MLLYLSISMTSKTTQENNKSKNLRIWSAFLYYDYRVLWLSGVTAMITMNLRMIITGVWLYERTGLGSTLAYLGLVELAVRIPANLYGGVFADRLDRKKLIAITQFSSFIFIGLMTILETSSALTIWHVYIVTAVLSATSVFGNPSRSALTARVVPRNVLAHAVAMNTITWQIGTIITPFVFFVTSFAWREGAAESMVLSFWINSSFALISVIFPLFIRESGKALNVKNSGNVHRNIIEGFKYVVSHPILPGLYILDIGVTVVSYYRELFPIFAKQLYSRGRDGVVILTSFNALGAIVGSLLVMYSHKIKRKGVIVLYATLAYGFLLILFGWSTSIWIGIFALIALGAADAVGMTMRQTIVQLTTPDNMRGRATAAHSLAAMSANGIGKWEVGIMSDTIGAGDTMILGGVVSIFVVLLIWYGLSGVRKYQYIEED
jgi:predicted MFS family arabinose efflux permease